MSDSSPVFYADGEDPEMQRAVKRARQTFRFFWRELSWEYRRIVPGLDLACVKVAFHDPGEDDVEQMWINEVTFDGRHVSGTLINSPNYLTSVAEGDHVEIRPGRVTDWMYAISEKVYGAFTVNVIRKQMSRRDRASHDDAWGLDFGNPDIIRLVPPEYLGAKGKSGSQNPADVSAVEHPMALNMCESLKEFASDPSNLDAVDDNGFTVLHQLALAGAARGVSILLELGADPSVKTHEGFTPAALAKVLGWKQVMEVLHKHS